MYLKIVCLSELNRNYFYLLPLRLLMLPVNKNCFSNIVGFCVYIINTIIHGCLEIWNFSSRVQFDISLVRYAHSWDIALNTRREIPYLRAPMYYRLFLSNFVCELNLLPIIITLFLVMMTGMKMITKDKIYLIIRQILLTSSIRNVWRTVWRICINFLYQGLKG